LVVEPAQRHQVLREQHLHQCEEQQRVGARADGMVLVGRPRGAGAPRIDHHDLAATLANRAQPGAHIRRGHQAFVGHQGIRAEHQQVSGPVVPEGRFDRGAAPRSGPAACPAGRRNGKLAEVSWDEAFAEIDGRLRALLGNRDEIAIYAGNPSVPNLLCGRVFYKALGTKNFYTAGSVDQLPKHFSSGYLFGDWFSIAVPDVRGTRGRTRLRHRRGRRRPDGRPG
jgi:hypothetical protein